MSRWLAPAKLNLTLMVGARSPSGLHPIRSLFQTVDLCDSLTVTEADEDHLETTGADLPEGSDNLVWKAVTALEQHTPFHRPRLRFLLEKGIPVAAGLGGGSADAAATLKALGTMCRLDRSVLEKAAPRIGSDVPAALRGGSLWVEGYGEKVSPAPPASGFALGLATPEFPVLTADVYRMWDDLDGPKGPDFPSGALPPALRSEATYRNDLQPAALAVCPELGDMMEHLAREWGRPVAMSGSGPSLFSYFLDAAEAAEAAAAVDGDFALAAGVGLFPGGPTEANG